jgi:hypothetical protein
MGFESTVNPLHAFLFAPLCKDVDLRRFAIITEL